MDTPPAAQAAAAAPKKAAKGVAGLLKGKPPAFYIVLVAGVLVAAYFIHKREASQPPEDLTASDVTTDGSFNPTYGPTDGALAGGYGSGAVDQTGAYGGGPIPTTNGFLYDPATGMVYGALPDNSLGVGDIPGVSAPAPSAPAVTGGGAPTSTGAEQHYPAGTVVGVVTPSSNIIGGALGSGTGCPADYPHPGTNPGSCYKVVCLKAGDGHGHGAGRWHVYRDGTWKMACSGAGCC